MNTSIKIIVIILVILGSHFCSAQNKNFEKFVPEEYVIFETIFGDVNEDGLEDCVLLIKGTDKKDIIINRFDKEADRNRRGLILLLNKNENYEKVLENYDCFSSENEDGGVYYPPELDVYIKKGKLYISYANGRYGYWKYTFRYQNSDLELIGYDSSANRGPIVNTVTSINYVTQKKMIRKNTNENTEESGDEIYSETWEKIAIDELLKLSEIEDFDELYKYTL